MKKISALAVAGVFAASLAGTAFAEMTDLKISGEIRVRHVEQNNYDLNSNAGDASNTTTQRTRVNVDAKVNETTKAYISLQDTRSWGSEVDGVDAGTTNTDETANENDHAVDISQAYIQLDKLAGQPLSLKLGRQILAYNARRFDALKLMCNTDTVNVDFFTANLKEAGSANPGDAQLNGLYLTAKTISLHKALDVYLIQKANSVAGENIMTYGLRLDGGTAGIDWTAEAAFQSGDAAATKKKKANMYVLKAGYTLPQIASLRIGAEYDFASGQDTSTDDTAFDNLYPTNHPLYGVTDITGTNTLSNLKAMSFNVGAKPAEGLKVVAEYWSYSKDQGDKTAIGNEMNVQAWYALNTNVDLHGFIARFTPSSDFSTTTDPADNVTLQLAVKF
ncbi:MAG: alginate export family protein [Deltaproteobacteria bacterium]|nr:alginate export family protein [Deltaproteobacteria bacterium]